jgi:hypothetical protein
MLDLQGVGLGLLFLCLADHPRRVSERSHSTGYSLMSGIHPGYRKEGSRQTPSRIPLYSY